MRGEIAINGPPIHLRRTPDYIHLDENELPLINDHIVLDVKY